MPLNEPIDESSSRILTDAKGQLIFLPNVIRAREIYDRDLSTPLHSDDFKNALPNLFLNYTTQGVEESEIEIDGAKYKASFPDFDNTLPGSIYVNPPEGSELPFMRIDPDNKASSIRKVILTSPEIYTSGNPPVSVKKSETYIGNELEIEYKGTYLTIPKDKVVFGISNEDGYDKINVAIVDDSKEGLSVSLDLSNQYTESGTGYPTPVIRLYQVDYSDLKDYGVNEEDISKDIVYTTFHDSPTFTTVEPGTKQYEVARDVAIAIAQQVTGKSIKDITPNELAEDLFKGKVAE